MASEHDAAHLGSAPGDAGIDITALDIRDLEIAGNQLFDDGEFKEAERVFAKLLEISTSESWYFFQAGRVAARLGHWREAVEYFDRALSCERPVEWVYYERALALREAGTDPKSLAVAFALVTEQAPGDLSDRHYDDLLQAADDAFNAAFYEEARALYALLVARGQGGYLSILRLADVELKRRKPREALRILNQGGSDPNYRAWSDSVRAGALVDLDEPGAAVELLKPVVEQVPDNPHFVRQLFGAAARAKDTELFRTHRKYLRIFAAPERLGLILRGKLASGDYKGAIGLYARVPESLATTADGLIAGAINGLIDEREFEILDQLALRSPEGRSNARLRKAGVSFVHVARRLRSAPPLPPTKRAAIVCWDLSHNPVGRAYVLYRLLEKEYRPELIGPIWQRFGRELWAPLRGEELMVRSFRPANLLDLWREAAAIALRETYDLVVICKPRLPGLIAGLLIAEQSNCPVIIDIDEHDLSFERGAPEIEEEELLGRPFGRTGTRLALEQLFVADAITVSSPLLQQQFSGHVIRHARDETLPLCDRAHARVLLGLSDDDFVLAFVGTVRTHKGLGVVLAAIQQIVDLPIKLLIAGSVSREVAEEIKARGLEDRVIRRGEFALSELPRFLAAADLVPLLQDPDDPISQTQMPAKLTDALQSGVRVVATDVPPLRDIAARGAVDLVSLDGFVEYLRKAASEPQDQRSRDHRRRIFEEEFSFASNRTRLAASIAEAVGRHAAAGNRAGAVLSELLDRTRIAQAATIAGGRGPKRSSRAGGKDALNIAFFWKQNDSDLFGRRSDMVAKYLSMAPQTGQLLHFDHAISFSDIRHMLQEQERGRRNVLAIQTQNTLGRMLGLADEPAFKRRIFIENRDIEPRSFAGRPTGGADCFADFIAASLNEVGLDPERTVAWVCPVVRGFGQAARKLRFRKVVVDLIDDQRFWADSDAEREAILAEYRATLESADLVMTNSLGNRRRFVSYRDDIVVIPNGAELDFSDAPSAVPKALEGLPKPIIGYIGNLRDRIDWGLVRALAERRPGWSFVLVGPIEEDRIPAGFGALGNVIFPGPVPYDQSRAWMRNFDVTMIPHLRAGLTESMNPLKIYNYLAAGAPVVTTPVANIEDVADLVSFAEGVDEFIRMIETHLASPPAAPPRERLEDFSWQRRVATMLDKLYHLQ